MKQALVLGAAALLAVPQAAMAQDALCEQLEAFAAAQWSEPVDPLPKLWVEFHWGVEGTTTARFQSWGCRDSGDAAAGEFCDWMMENTWRTLPVGLVVGVQRCIGDEPTGQAATGRRFIDGEVRRQAADGSWVVLEVASSGMRPGESAVRISFDSDDRRLEPEELPEMQAFADTAE